MRHNCVVIGASGGPFSLFTVDIGLESVRLPDIEVIGDQQGQEIIVGRNVPNRLKTLLDGPSGLVNILDS